MLSYISDVRCDFRRSYDYSDADLNEPLKYWGKLISAVYFSAEEYRYYARSGRQELREEEGDL